MTYKYNKLLGVTWCDDISYDY